MKKNGKILLILASVLTIVGFLGFMLIMTIRGWDFSTLSTEDFETNTYNVSEKFDKISIDVSITDINFVLVEDESCSVVCKETEKLSHSVSVKDDTLVIRMIDKRKWYDNIGINIGSYEMTVYLNENEYKSMKIETNTGDVKIKSLTAYDDIDVKTDTGDINLTDISCTNLETKTDTGDITLKRVIAEGEFDIKSDTGDVQFSDSDAEELYAETDTGDVTGTLCSEKIFQTHSDTGDIHVPDSLTGGRCKITTDTGDIEIRITS
ncbi:MAG: DUF4097 family beta strand repeat protein [Clostridia bacterium]|nr:DUF4097 family beta strand repeat protein [Clostridia bacterium]